MILMDNKQVTTLVFKGTNGKTVTKALTESGTIPIPTQTDTRTFTLNGTTTIDVTNLKTLTVVVDVEGGETKTLIGISATYTGGDVPAGTNINTLKTNLTVTGHYDDGTDTIITTGYTLAGTIEIGTNTITVSYEGFTATFEVTGTDAPIPQAYGWSYSRDGGYDQGSILFDTYSAKHGYTKSSFKWGYVEIDVGITTHTNLSNNPSIALVRSTQHGNAWVGFSKSYYGSSDGFDIEGFSPSIMNDMQMVKFTFSPTGSYAGWADDDFTRVNYGYIGQVWEHIFYGLRIYDETGTLIFHCVPTETAGVMRSVLDDTTFIAHQQTDGITVIPVGA